MSSTPNDVQTTSPYQQIMPVSEAGGSHMINPTDADTGTTDVGMAADAPLSQEEQDIPGQLAQD